MKKSPTNQFAGNYYTKKRKSDECFPSDSTSTSVKVSRGSVKAGDWMELQFNTSETYELCQGLKQLYALYNDIGEIPYRSAKTENQME